jgi:lipid-A-disaccharide synthase-like uncharacterized protein
VGSRLRRAYAVHRRDPVFVLGLTPGVLISVRTLHLSRRQRRIAAVARGASGSADVAR